MRPPRPRRGVFRLIPVLHTQFYLHIFPISFRFGFSACFSLPRVSPHRYRSVVYCRAHPKYVLCTYAPSSPTLWVFLLNFSPSHPVSSPYLSDQLPVWGFLLAFLCLRPRRGVFRLIPVLHTQFYLRIFPISFRFGFFCLLFSVYAHIVGFSA